MKEKFVKSTFILLIGGFFTKILGMMIKMTMARKIGSTGLGMYMLILPTFMLFIQLSQLGLPLALSKLVAEEKSNHKKLFFSILFLIIIVNISLMILIFLLAPFISRVLLHRKETYPSILAMALVIPFTSISSICRSYFFGKQQMLPHVLSNLAEDLVRLFLIIFLTPFILPLGLPYTVCFFILSNVVSELISTIILLLFLPKNIHITKKDLTPNKKYIKESLQIGLPSTTSRMIGSIGFFLEPILLTNGLMRSGYSMSYITNEYGIISGYVIPLVLLPSFFTLAISQALLPIISKESVMGNKKKIRKSINLAIFLSLLIAIPITLLLMIYPTFFLQILYHTTKGIPYLKVLAPICLLEYLQAPLSSCLDGMGKTKDNLIASLLGMSTRTILLFLLSSLKIGLWSLIISISINILFTTLYQIQKVREYLQ